MVSNKFGRSMHAGSGFHFGSSYSTSNKRGAGRGNIQRGSRQSGRWRGATNSGPSTGPSTGWGRGRHLQNAYPSQPSRTLANVIRYQRNKGIVPGRPMPEVNNAALRKQFPVSSGSQHREKENPGPKEAPHLKLMVQDDGYTYSTPSRFSGPTSSAPRFGMKMLQKFGWSPGKGLGKNEEGTIEPVIPDGLYAQEYQPKKEPMEVIEDMSAKHPVMALTELCTRHKWPAPKFEVVDYSGPDHQKKFLMKVIVNGQEYKPDEASATKKIAKAEAAAFFLESLGMYDRKKAPQWN